MKRLIAFLLALTMLFALAACTAKTETADAAAPSKTSSNDSAASSGTTRLVLGTSTTGSTYYILGTGWADVMKSAVPGVEISIEATPGGITNMQSMRSGDMDMGMTTSWLGGDGWAGTSWAEGTKYDNCLSMFPTHSSVLYIFTLADSGINSIMDLEGKAIATGALGSTSGDAVPLLLDALGITVKSTANLASSGICDALKDGTVDVGFGVTGVPASWMLDLETSKDIKIIPLTEDEISTILAAQPYWSSGVIPGGVYKNHDEDIPCITFGNFSMANKDMDEELVYNLVKATFENKAEIEKVDKNAAGIDVANFGFLTMPLHPGAQRYYEEIGVEIPDNLKLG